jgi:DNA-binding transcriptional LysR family regulator
MNLEYLKALAAAAQHRNITKAAQELRTSQPSLSKQLKKLEEIYNTKLLVRSGMGVELTQDGIEFLKFAEAILEQLQMLECRFQKRTNSAHIERLRVGAGYALSASILPMLLGEFKKEYSHVEVDLRSNTTVMLEHMLIKGNLDIVVSSIAPDASELTAEPCMRLKVIAVAAKGYSLPNARKLKLGGIEQLPLIIRSGPIRRGISERLLKELQEQGHKPKILMRCDSPEAIKTAVSKKLGVGILYENIVKDALTRGEFKRVPLPGFPRSAVICRLPQESPSLSSHRRISRYTPKAVQHRSGAPRHYQ